MRSMETVETVMETDGDGSGGTSPSRQGVGTETSVPQICWRRWQSYGTVLVKTPIVLGFSIGRLFIGEGASSGGDLGGLTTGGRQGARPRPLMVRLASGPPPALVRSSVLFQEK
jgi:hypothetical protein